MFVVDAGGTEPEPVPFDETTSLGIAAEERLELREQGLSVPRVQVFYSQYQYVVGYRGVESAVDMLQQPAHEQQFGYPLAVYVEAFGGDAVEQTDKGYLRAESDSEWHSASEVSFVVGSGARTPAGETAVPFASEAMAATFVEEYGGDIRTWEQLQQYEFELEGAAVVRDRVTDQRASADERVTAARELMGREQSVVVGEDSPTVQAAVDAAPDGTTVLVPEGTYAETVVVNKSITLKGTGATIRGDGNGTVITVKSDDVGIVGLDIEGVGNRTRAREGEVGDDWDAVVDTGYAYGDAAILAANVSGTYVANVSIQTRASGVLFRDASHSVVENSAVKGPTNWRDGFMSVNAIRSPVVVQNSTFESNRDGIYLHRSHNTVIRENTFRHNRYAVHLMYTSDSLVADNIVREQSSGGIIIMTTPTRNAVVGNDIRNTGTGIIPGGSRSYIADNVVAFNDLGMSTGATQSLYEQNLIYHNNIGIRSAAVRPSNRVVQNDFVANNDHAKSGIGPLRIWTHDGTGNYWEGATRWGNGERSYSPTDPTDGMLHRTDGTVTLAESPAKRALDIVQDTTPGMRDGDIVDTAPLSEPVNPARLAEIANDGPETEDDDD
nr:NosD domain-containing protein [Halovenus rubra]